MDKLSVGEGSAVDQQAAKDDVAAADFVQYGGVTDVGRRRRGAEDLFLALGVAYLRRVR